MKFAGASLALIILATSSSAAGADDEAMPAALAANEFARAEEARLLAAGAGEASSVIDLARFYMANGLWVEALARLRSVDTPDAALLSAECDYRMGRYGAVAERLEQAGPKSALRAVALTRIGAFAEATEIFKAGHPLESATVPGSDFFLSKAESLAEENDADGAAEALSHVTVDSYGRKFVAAKIRALRGEKGGSLSLMGRAAAGDDEWAMRARVALAVANNEIGALEELALEWRGQAFDRDLQMAIGGLRLQGKDFDRGFRAYRIVVDRFAQSDAARKAQEAIGDALPLLFAEQTGLHPKSAAELFFNYVEFAPAGTEGDALIREATDKLQALGLYAQAAALLDHQVFMRLRGAERAKIAADLAEIQLTAKKPEEALRVIRSTRIAGLDGETSMRRRLVEAKALAEIGKYDNALALLSEARGGDNLLLRADINWKRRAWTEAAEDYAAFYATDKSRPDAAVRAATAFLLAEDRVGYRSFALSAEEKLEGSPEGDLIRSLGGVDQERFLARFMSDYRRAYDRGRS